MCFSQLENEQHALSHHAKLTCQSFQNCDQPEFVTVALPNAVTRTLTGHRSSCLSVDFHPFGDFLASGSLDTTLKVWDLRRKACISTYRAHGRGVSIARFSPDGRLLASGGQDGDLKVCCQALMKIVTCRFRNLIVFTQAVFGCCAIPFMR